MGLLHGVRLQGRAVVCGQGGHRWTEAPQGEGVPRAPRRVILRRECPMHVGDGLTEADEVVHQKASRKGPGHGQGEPGRWT